MLCLKKKIYMIAYFSQNNSDDNKRISLIHLENPLIVKAINYKNERLL